RDVILRTAAGRLQRHVETVVVARNADDLGYEPERHALLRIDALELLRHLAVHARQDAVEIFHDRHVGTETAPHGAEFEPEHPRAHTQQPLRRGGQREGTRRRYDIRFVDLAARK